MNTSETQLQLINFLEAFLPSVDSKIPTDINEGGCGIFAKHLFLNLQSLGLTNEFKIFYLSSKKGIDALNYTIANNKIKNKHVGIQHCYVRINDFIFVDSKGIEVSPVQSTKNSKNMLSGEISLEVLQTLIDNIGSWNEIFDRDCEETIAFELGKMKEQFTQFQLTGALDAEITASLPYTENTVKAKRKMMDMSGIGALAQIFGR